MKSFLLSCLLVVAIFGLRGAWQGIPDRLSMPPSQAAISFVAVPDEGDWGPLRLVGRWHVRSSEPRLAGLSALAIDGERLLAVGDAGVIVRFPKPGSGGQARIADLPSGPGAAAYKSGRDSEALVADPAGRGWWVGFENGHEVRLFDRKFEATLAVVSLRDFGWHRNRGVEALAIENGLLTAYAEDGRDRLILRGTSIERGDADGTLARLADIAALPEGGQVAISRSISPLGIRSRLMVRGSVNEPWRLLTALPVGRLTNPEGIIAEGTTGGAVRLWIISDNDFRRRVPTELFALDWNR